MRSKLGLVSCLVVFILGAALLVGEVAGSSRDEPEASLPGSTETVSPDPPPAPPEEVTAEPTPSSQNQPDPTAGTTSHKVRIKPGVPVRLVVPKLHIRAAVEPLGKTASGAQAVPDSVSNVAWWKHGWLPGQLGNAVFAGHTWSQGDGVFDRLEALRRGDAVKVRNLHGKWLTFRVTRVDRDVAPNLSADKVAAIYTDRTDKPGVALITCGDFSGGTYHSRIVVYAQLQQ